VPANNRRRCACPRLHALLRAEGKRVGRHRVARLMGKPAIPAQRRRRLRNTTHSRHAVPPAANLLARQFAFAVAPNQLHQPDRGSPYAAQEYRRVLDQHEIRCSMSRKGDR